MDIQNCITNQLQAHSNMIDKTSNMIDDIIKCSNLILHCFQYGGKLILFGNGGSAADAQHIAGEFVGLLRITDTRKSYDAISLTTNTSIITALVNDNMAEEIFSRQLEAIGKPGDVVIGISTSGNSRNIVKGLLAAKDKDMTIIGFTGEKDSTISSIADLTIKIPSTDTPRIQEGHITVGHIICDIVMQQLQEDNINV